MVKNFQFNNEAFFVLIALLLIGGNTQDAFGRDKLGFERLVSGIFLEEPTRRGLPQGKELRKMPDMELEITKLYEGWGPKRYNDPAGYCTIGYGHLLKLKRCDESAPAEFASCEISTRGEFRRLISKSRGEQVLRCDMVPAEVAVTRLARDDLTDGQFSALADFTFNVGTRNFERSTLLRVVNEGDYQRVPIEFRKWVLAGGKKYKGLQERREKEIKLFFNGTTRGGRPQESELIDIRVGEPGNQ